MPAHTRRFSTWGRTFSSTPTHWLTPDSEGELVKTVRLAHATGKRIKVVGAGHSWSAIAVPDEILVSLDRLNSVLEIDRQTLRITVEAGMRLRDLNEHLANAGLALSILGSVTAQSIAGALSTGTHGSSLVHGNLASCVTGVRLITGTGEVLELTETDDRLNGVRVGLGACGILTRVTLQVEPAFRLHEIQETLTWTQALDRVLELARREEYVKLWWLPHTEKVQVFRYQRTTAPTTFKPWLRWVDEHLINRWIFEGLLRFGALFPSLIPTLNALVGVVYFAGRETVGRSDLVLSIAMPAVHRETEYAIPLEHTREALERLRSLIESQQFLVNFVVEARFVKGDSSWMSPAYGQDVCQLGAYMANSRGIDAYFEGFAAFMKAMGGRPHWGKEFSATTDEIQQIWPKYQQFKQLVKSLDPTGVFRNAFLDKVLGDGG